MVVKTRLSFRALAGAVGTKSRSLLQTVRRTLPLLYLLPGLSALFAQVPPGSFKNILLDHFNQKKMGYPAASPRMIAQDGDGFV